LNSPPFPLAPFPGEFEQSGIRHPLWVSSPDGTWRARIKSLRTNVVLDDALFAKPKGE
jgi:hypothetical protein